MAQHDAEIQDLSDSLVNEIVNAVGLPKMGITQRTFDRLFHKATERLATIGVTTDRIIAKSGLSKGAEWMHSNWCSSVSVRGQETIPQEGPLLIVSNHAGTYDSLILTSRIGREDLKIISSDIPFFKKLPNISSHLIFLSDKTGDRVAATRSGIRQLKGGGAFLIFGTGLIDPDPEVYPDAGKQIEHWSPSIDLFLQTVPEARVVVTIISGVLSQRWGHHPITWLRRIDWQKRRLAEFGQVLQQLFSPGSLYLAPHVSFAPPVSVEVLRRESGSGRVLPAVIARGKTLLVEHMVWMESIKSQ
jgi:hypothetical protein